MAVWAEVGGGQLWRARRGLDGAIITRQADPRATLDTTETTVSGADGAADRSFALSLRLLTILVWIGLAGSLAMLAYPLVRPPQNSAGPVSAAHLQAAPERLAAPVAPAEPRVVMDPGRVAFRCEEQGRTTFSDVASSSGCVPVNRSAADPAPAPGATAGAAPPPGGAPAAR